MNEIYDNQIKLKHKANGSADKAKSQNSSALDSIIGNRSTEEIRHDTGDIFLDDMVFSFSNLTAFETCPYSWYFNYIRGENKEGNIYGEFGTSCHQVLEKFVKGEIEQDDLAMAFIDSYNENVNSVNEWNANIATNLFNIGFEYFADCSMDKLHLRGCKIVGVEYQCNFKIGNNKFIGFIDLLIQDPDGNLIVIDHKSGEYPMTKSGTVKAKQTEKLESYKRQLYLYSKAVYEKFHKYPAKLVWNFFKSNDWLVIPFNETEYQNTLKWAQDVIDDIYLTVEYEAKPQFFFCHNICDFRSICDKCREDL